MRHPSSAGNLLAATFAVAIACGLASQSSLYAEIIVNDTFSLTGTRTETGNLNNTPVETGTGTWKVTAGAVTKFTASGTITNNNTAKGVITGRIAIAAPTTLEQVQIIATPGNCDWAGVGFLAADTAAASPWFGSTDTQVWFYVRPTGVWELYANGTSLKLGSGTLTGLATDWGTTAHTLTLQYNPTNSKVNALVDNVSITNGWISTGSATISIGAAGFYVNAGGDSKPSTTSSIDSFQVATIPEVASLSILGLGSLVFALPRR